MYMEALFEGVWGSWVRKAMFAAAAAGAVFLSAAAISNVMGWQYIGADVPAGSTISVSGHGEATGTPDIATFTFSIVSEKKTVSAAQADATAKANAATAYLAEHGVEEKDIQTSGYSIYPKYDYTQNVCTSYSCPPSQQILRGYEVRQSTSVKVRDLAAAGDLLTGVASAGATELSGLTFTFDDPDTLETEARAEAIAEAKTKAKELARELGVSLKRVVYFSETGGAPVPMYASYGKGGAYEADVASAPRISPGENKVSTEVTITYEIR